MDLPIVTRVLTLPWEKPPFRAWVYFVGKPIFLDQKWYRRQPIRVRDSDFGIVRLGGFGKYVFRVADAAKLINSLVETLEKCTIDQVTALLRDMIVSRLTDLIGTVEILLPDMPAKFDELSAGARAKVSKEFSKYGLELTDFGVNSLDCRDRVARGVDRSKAIW